MTNINIKIKLFFKKKNTIFLKYCMKYFTILNFMKFLNPSYETVTYYCTCVKLAIMIALYNFYFVNLQNYKNIFCINEKILIF